jgi:hypothetical protein
VQRGENGGEDDSVGQTGGGEDDVYDFGEDLEMSLADYGSNSKEFDVSLNDAVADDNPVFGDFPSLIRASLALIDRQLARAL